MQIKAIHQFSPSCSPGDGVTNGLFFTRRLLRELGFESEIYSDFIPEPLAKEVKPLGQFNPQAGELLFMHHSLGMDNAGWLSNLTIPKVMVYHNITPVHLLPEDDHIRRLSVLGRQQLVQWAPDYIGAIGDSEYNSMELRETNYRNVATIPLLVDTNMIRHAPWNPSSVASLRDAINLLFVGRVCENKRQLDLLEVLAELLHYVDQPVRLILAGGITSPDYQEKIQSRIRELGLEGNVLLAGKVPNETLFALYRIADAFICMSEHEGFGMPLIESMLFDVPVVARGMCSIPYTLGEGGLILKNGDPREAAAVLHTLLSEPGLRRRVIAGQRRNIQRFDVDHLRRQLAEYLTQLGIQVPRPPEPASTVTPKPYWQVEGPFDSSYSLAIVNRELGRVLAARGNDIGLRSMEGSTGDFEPNQVFLAANPDCAAMAKRARDAHNPPDVALRFCYPPHVDDMHASIRVVHSYGWEETGFPTEYVAAFNRKLDLVTVLSREVEKILRDNGVRVPMAVTGGGVDHLQNVSPQAPDVKMRSFRFLHISSCFPRKGVDALLQAYGKAFRQGDDVSLVIKTFPNPHNDVEQQLACLRQDDPQYPDVVLINRDCSQEELVGLYRACHAFVAPSRGEGLGLPMAEAMLFNLPVITTAWGGQTDFCDESTAWMCDYRFAKAQTHLGMAHSVWADPDVDHLANLMREVYNSTDERRRQRTLPARQRVLRDYTWDQVASRTEQAIAAVAAQPLFQREVPIGWVSTWNTRCGIATYTAFLSVAFPADRLTILANHTSEQLAEDGANVIRCWNNLSETLDDVYDTAIARGLRAVVIQFNYSFFKLSAFARLIDRLKDASIAVHCFFHSTRDVMLLGVHQSLSSIAKSLKRADRLYVHGVQDMNILKDFGLVDNVVFFPHGVLPMLPPLSPSERAERGLEGKKIIGSYGFLLPHKGVQQLIQAFAQLAKKDETLHLLLLNSLYPIIDSEQEKQACDALIDKLGIAKRVTFITDFLPDTECLARLQTADLIVYPYQHTQESASGAVRIGLAAGRPVAVTPLPIFDDVAGAVHVLLGTDSEALANGIKRLLTDPEEISRQMAKTQQWVASREWALLSVRLLNLIDSLANPLTFDARHA